MHKWILLLYFHEKNFFTPVFRFQVWNCLQFNHLITHVNSMVLTTTSPSHEITGCYPESVLIPVWNPSQKSLCEKRSSSRFFSPTHQARNILFIYVAPRSQKWITDGHPFLNPSAHYAAEIKSMIAASVKISFTPWMCRNQLSNRFCRDDVFFIASDALYPTVD